MQKSNTYKVIREYDNRYELEDLIRRIIRCHLEEFSEGNMGLQFPGCGKDRCNERLTG